MKNLCYILLLAIIIQIVPGCDKEPSVQRYQIPKSEAPAVGDIDESGSVVVEAGITNTPYNWTAPPGWEALPASGMRMASFSISYQGETGDCSIIKLGEKAGGIPVNIVRWRGQIGLPDVDEETILSAIEQFDCPAGTCHYVKLINDEQPDKAILATILPDENAVLFIKLWATKTLVNAAEQEFKAFCQSIEKN